MKKKILGFSLFMLLSLASCSVDLPVTSPTPSSPSSPSSPGPSDSSTTSPSTPDSSTDSSSTDSSPVPPPPVDTPLDQSVNNILSDSLSTTTTVTHRRANTSVISTRTSAVNYDANALEVSYTDTVNNSFNEDLFYEREENNGTGAYRVFVNANNGLQTKEKLASTNAWNDFTWIKDFFNHGEFVEEEGYTYRYTGNQKREIIKALSKIDINDLDGAPAIDALTLTTSADGTRVESLKAETLPVNVNNETDTKYEIEITIAPTATAPTIPGQPNQGGDEATIGAVFGTLNTSGSFPRYRAITTNTLTGDRKETVVINNEIIYTKATVSGNTSEEKGWYKAEKGWISFETVNNSTTADENTITQESIAATAKLEIQINYRNFIYDPADRTQLIPGKYVENFGANLHYNLSPASSIVDRSVKIKIDKDAIAEISYDVVSGATIGRETIKFDRSDSVVMNPTTLQNIRKAADLAIPPITSWAEETNKNIQTELNNLFGAQVASTLPYSYLREASKKWNPSRLGEKVTVFANGTYAYNDEFTAKYLAELNKQGFVKEANTERYYKGNVYAKIVSSEARGLAIEFGIFVNSWREYSNKYDKQFEPNIRPQVLNAIQTALKEDALVDQVPFINVVETYSASKRWKVKSLQPEITATLVVEDSGYDANQFITDYSNILLANNYEREGTTNKYHNNDISIEILTPAQTIIGLSITLYIPDPTNWREENASAYNSLVTYFYGSSSAVDGIPYLYLGGDNRNSNWSATPQADGSYKLAPANNYNFDNATFTTQYSTLLKNAQFVQQNGTNTYVKGTVSVTIDSTGIGLTLKRIPTSWQLLSTSVYNAMMLAFDNNAATVNSVPYLYTEGVTDKFTAGEQPGQVILNANGLTKAVADKYRSDYAALLNSNGYTPVTGQTNQYSNGTLKITIGGNDTVVGLQIENA